MIVFELKELFSKNKFWADYQTEQAIRKSQNGELENGMRTMRTIRVGMQGMEWEDGYGESEWQCEESAWKCEKCGESGCWCRKSRWKFNYSGEITWNSNGNDKFKDWREAKIIKLLSHIWRGAFLVNFEHIYHNVFLFLLLILNKQIPVGKVK